METDSWQARLELEYHHINSTVLTKNSHYGPLVVQKPFYDHGECHTYILHPPGGIANKDKLDTHITLHSNTQVVFTTTGAGKFYRSYHDEVTTVHQTLYANQSVLEWLPLENIYFDGARSKVTLECEITDAKLMLWDIHHAGSHPDTQVSTTTKIIKDDSLVCLDTLRINEEQRRTISNFHSYSAFGNFFISPGDNNLLEIIRTIIAKDAHTQSGATLVRGIIILRSLSDKARYIQQLFIRIWQQIRPVVIGLEPHPPRIWAT